jgi:hypothetical protein
MQNKSTTPEHPSAKVEVVLALPSGEKLILDIQAFADFFEEAEMRTPQEFSDRFQQLMDQFVETVDQSPDSAFDQIQFKSDYEFLRKFRELFKRLEWKEVPNES